MKLLIQVYTLPKKKSSFLTSWGLGCIFNKCAREESILDIAELNAEMGKYLLMADPYIIEVLAATILANRSKDEPVWMLVNGPPGSLKTQLSRNLRACQGIRLLNKISDKTFLSGYSKKRDHSTNESLLPKLTERGVTTLINLDFGNVLSQRSEVRIELFQQFRQIYDGLLTSDYGTGDEITWEGFMGFIGCTTPEIDKHQTTITKLGDRFLMYRTTNPEDKEIARRVSKNRGVRGPINDHIKEVWEEFLDGQVLPSSTEVELGGQWEDEVENLAILLARARTPVKWEKDGGFEEIEYNPFSETPARLTATLGGFAGGVGAARKLEKMTDEAMEVVRKVVFDTIPPKRMVLLNCLAAGSATINEICDKTSMTRRQIDRKVEELEVLGLLDQQGKRDKKISLTDMAGRVLKKPIRGVIRPLFGNPI